MISIKALTLFVLMAILLGCSEYEEDSRISMTGEYDFYYFINKIKKFPYKAPNEKLERVTNGFSKITLGLKKNEALKMLGKPDGESISYEIFENKEKQKYTTWSYYLFRQEKELASPSDESIHVYFNLDNEVYFAYMDNSESLTQGIGVPWGYKANK